LELLWQIWLMIAFQFLKHALCEPGAFPGFVGLCGGFSVGVGAGLAGSPVAPEISQKLGIAQRIGLQLQDGFTGLFFPELLGPCDPGIHLFDGRFHQAAGQRQTLLAILRGLHQVSMVALERMTFAWAAFRHAASCVLPVETHAARAQARATCSNL